MAVTVRLAQRDDSPDLANLINAIIAQGGSTAHTRNFTPERFFDHYISAETSISCCVAQDATGRLIGFQSLGKSKELPGGWAEVGTFVALDAQRSGAGAAMFEHTAAAAKAHGVTTVKAAIRADNISGLGYYARLGFVHVNLDSEFALSDGTVVGQITKRFDLV